MTEEGDKWREDSWDGEAHAHPDGRKGKEKHGEKYTKRMKDNNGEDERVRDGAGEEKYGEKRRK